MQRTSNGAVQHGLAWTSSFHLLELRRIGLYIVVWPSDHAGGRGWPPNVIGNIDADALFFKVAAEVRREEFASSACTWELIEGALIGIGTENGVIERSDAFPIASDLRGDALIDFRWQTRITTQNG